MNHWQTIEDALASARFDLDQGYDSYTQEQREQKRAEYTAALAFVREMRQGVQPLELPDSPGWWAWEEGQEKGVSEIYAGSQGELIASDEPGGLTVDYYSGRKWHKLQMPWDAQEADS